MGDGHQQRGGVRAAAPECAPAPAHIEVRGARVHNLRDIDVDVPLSRLVAIAGVSGSGKSSLALGTLYAEGSRRYIEALSTYTRRRLSQAARAEVDSVRHVPAALALRQRPGMPGVRSTFGTMTELLNVLRVFFSRLASHMCPNGHRVPPTLNVAAERPVVCPECGAVFHPPGAEALAFNSAGACPTCEGTGTVREIDESTLIPDPSRTIDDGAVAPWNMMGLRPQPQVVREMGVRTDVPFEDLEPQEREVVLSGPSEKRTIVITSKNGKAFELDWTYRNAHVAVREALDGARDERGLARVARFLVIRTCPDCHGTRLSPTASAPQVSGLGLAQVTAMTLDQLLAWLPCATADLPPEMQEMARHIASQFTSMATRLIELGLGYLSLDRAGSTLSTGERQRIQLARAVRNETWGVLYVLDEPSIGLHPANVEGLLGVMRDLLANGNSVVFVDHDVQVLRESDWIIEIGPGSGAQGGTVVAKGTVEEIAAHPDSLIGGFLDGREGTGAREPVPAHEVFELGDVHLRTAPVHTVHALEAHIPRGRLTAVTGMSGSGKTTLVLESLVPALRGAEAAHVTEVDTEGITRVNVVDAAPIGQNVRSTVGTYSKVLDELRKAYAQTHEARAQELTAGDFSFNTGSLRCPTCEGTGQISLDVQFLPDVDIDCPDCRGSRYAPEAEEFRRPDMRAPRAGAAKESGETTGTGLGGISLPELLGLTVSEAIEAVSDLSRVVRKLRTLEDLGLGYLTLNEDTPALSGGEAQRLKLSGELGRRQSDALFVLDEPSVGLHPLDTRVLLHVLDRLTAKGATVIVIEHDLDMIANADWVIDMGPGGGEDGGRIVATGTPAHIAEAQESVTGRYLRAHLGE